MTDIRLVSFRTVTAVKCSQQGRSEPQAQPQEMRINESLIQAIIGDSIILENPIMKFGNNFYTDFKQPKRGGSIY